MVDVDSLQKYERNHTFLGDVKCPNNNNDDNDQSSSQPNKKPSLLHLSPCASLQGECFQVKKDSIFFVQLTILTILTTQIINSSITFDCRKRRELVKCPMRLATNEAVYVVDSIRDRCSGRLAPEFYSKCLAQISM